MQMDLLKYSNYDVVFQEVPGEVALAINITQCPHHCDGCHSAVLAGDFGNYLKDDIGSILKQYGDYITCVLLMGGDQHMSDLVSVLRRIKRETKLKTGVYSGSDDFGLFEPAFPYLDFLKIGPYKKELGGLTSSNTNQRFYRKENGEWVDRTQLFQRKGDQSNDDYYEES